MTELGCYGLRIRGLTGAARHLTPLADDAPVLHVRQHVDPSVTSRPLELVSADEAVLNLSDGTSYAEVDRRDSSVTLHVATRYDDEALLHPMLSGTFSVANRWLGRDAFHAGAFLLGSRAWAVLGDRGRGKSTTLGYLATRDVPVLTDDVVIHEAGAVFSGPTFVDLRPDASAALGVGRDVGVLGARHRVRFEVPSPGLDRAPLAGWLRLVWGDEVRLRRLALPERLAMLYDNRTVRLEPVDPSSYLRHAILPCYELMRPPEFASLPLVHDLLHAELA